MSAPPAGPKLSDKERDRLAAEWEAARAKLLAYLEWRFPPALRPRVSPADVLNDAFTDAARRWSEFDPKQWTSSYAWLFGIVRDRLIETWRHHARAMRDPRKDMALPERSAMQLGMSLMAAGPGPVSEALRAERARLVHDALDQLPEADRELLTLRYIFHMSFAEAAEVLGITEGNANVRHLRALRKFRDIWKSQFSRDGSQA